MAEFDMWGPGQDGFAIGQENAQKARLNELAIQSEQVKLQQNQQKQVAQQKQQQQMQEVIARGRAKSALELSQDMIKEGLVEEGGKLMSQAAQAENHIASADKSKFDTAENKIKARQKMIETFASTVDNIHNQDDYNRAIQEFEPQLGVTLPDTIKNATWSPEYKERLQKLGSTWKERATVEMESMKFTAQEREREGKDRLQEAQLAKTEAQTKQINIKLERLQKDAGSNIKTARLPQEDVEQVVNMLGRDFPEGASSSEKANAAYFIASRAQTMLQQNKGMDRASAIQRSYNEAKRNGELTTVTSGGVFGFFENKKMGFEPKEAPQPSVPKAGDVQDGYKFKGGDPSKQSSWEKQ